MTEPSAARSILGLFGSSVAMLTVTVVAMLVWSSDWAVGLGLLAIGLPLTAWSLAHFGTSTWRAVGLADDHDRVVSASARGSSDEARARNRKNGARWLIGLGVVMVGYNAAYLVAVATTDRFSGLTVFAVVFGGVLGTFLIVSGGALRRRSAGTLGHHDTTELV